MSEQLDIFTRYPQFPGWQRTSTSEAAAHAIKPKAETLRDAVYDAIRAWGFTADECAEFLDESVLSVRPRVTELFKMGLIEDSGERRKNKSGRNAIGWRAKQ